MLISRKISYVTQCSPQKFDKNLTKIWQKFDKNLTKIWQKADKVLFAGFAVLEKILKTLESSRKILEKL